MAVLKLFLSDFDAIDYDLIAIHTSIENYRVAYFLNQKLPILLNKDNDLVDIKTLNGSAFFAKFSYFVEETEEEWTLIENKDEFTDLETSIKKDLFSNEQPKIATNLYFLPEMKKVDFFLKIENTVLNLTEIVSQINALPQISTAYIVDVEKIKSKNNLIF